MPNPTPGAAATPRPVAQRSGAVENEVMPSIASRIRPR